MIKILVTGANGQLGRSFYKKHKSFTNYNFLFKDRESLDISNSDSLVSLISFEKPDIIINCAAYTAVDRAESEPDKAYEINHLAVSDLTKICSEKSIKLIHFSTDFVFNGQSSLPYKEEDNVDPIGIYASSKSNGEKAIIESESLDFCIIRTSWVYSEFAKNFVKTMLDLFKQKSEINVINDQIGSPTYASDIVDATMYVIINNISGLVHYSNIGKISWYDFASTIRNLSGRKTTINSISTSQYPTPAKRPKYSVLDLSKSKNLGLPIKHWKVSLKQCLKLI